MRDSLLEKQKDKEEFLFMQDRPFLGRVGSAVCHQCVSLYVYVFWCLCAPVPGCISVYDSAVISQGEEPVQVQTAYLPFACIHSF